MYSGFYKCDDPNVRTKEWLALNFLELPTDSLRALSAGYEALDGYGYEIEPISTSKDDDEDDVEPMYTPVYLPVYGSMWVADYSVDIVDPLNASGFSTYRIPSKFFGFSAIAFGVNSAGYSFLAHHFLPLRLRLIKVQSDFLGADPKEDLIQKMVEEAADLGQEKEIKTLIKQLFKNN